MKKQLLSATALAAILVIPAFYVAHAQTPAAPSPGAAAQAALVAKDDTVATNRGNAVVHPIGHASVLITWNGKKVLVDPAPSAMTGGGGGGELSEAALAPFKALGTPDIILVTHAHGDHFNVNVLSAVTGPNTVLGVPQVIYNALTPELKAKATIMANGDTSMLSGIEVQAVAMYNITPERRNHPEGVGNGYVVTLGDKRFYFAGDTEEAPELSNLPNIDVAFIPMNLPYTQTPEAAGAWVRNFKPKIVYPYHFSNNDLTGFQAWASTTSEVRILKWY